MKADPKAECAGSFGKIVIISYLQEENMKNITRRDFLKGSAAVVGASLVSSLGIRTCADALEAEAAAEYVIPDHPVDGRYVTRAVGHESWVYVSTLLKDGRIAACDVVRNNETMGIGNYACARIPAAIVANQSINVPNVRGCSTTCRAIKEAVKEALVRAGYNPDDFNAKIEREMSNEKIERECDVIVCGAGTAGLVAAARLAEKGLNVIVVEKRDIPGGSMAMTYGGVLTTGSRRQFAYDVNGTLKGTASGDLDVQIETLKTQVINPERASEEMPFCRVLYKNSTELSDWLSDIGVGFRTFGVFEGDTSWGTGLSLAPGMYMGGVGYCMMLLADRIGQFPNSEIIYATSVTDLIKDENGRIVGVHAKGENGNEYTLTAKAVCLTTGGFARNRDMIAAYNPEHVGQFFNCASASEGDGIRMGLDAGSVVDVIDTELPAYLSSRKRLFELAFLGAINGFGATNLIFVNTNGDNIGSCVSHVNCSNTKLDPSNGDRFFCVFDSTTAEAMRKSKAMGFDTYNAMFECGDAVHYDSVEALVEELNLPNLPASIEAYNQMGYLETRDGVWALEVTPTFYITTSGLKCDYDCHILTEAGEAIPGLYGAGDVLGSVEKHDGLRYSYGFDSAIAFGYHMADILETELA